MRGAALLAGASPYFIFERVPSEVWQQCQLLYLCSPGNPTGAVVDATTLQQLIELADRHDFIIASDECYSELYPDEKSPPVGMLQVAPLANFIMKHTSKQEHINEILKSKGSNYRIGNVEIEVGVPPKVVLVVERQSEG